MVPPSTLWRGLDPRGHFNRSLSKTGPWWVTLIFPCIFPLDLSLLMDTWTVCLLPSFLRQRPPPYIRGTLPTPRLNTPTIFPLPFIRLYGNRYLCCEPCTQQSGILGTQVYFMPLKMDHCFSTSQLFQDSGTTEPFLFKFDTSGAGGS